MAHPRIVGLQWENLFISNCQREDYVVHPRGLMGERKGRRFIQVKSPYDFMVTYKKKAVFLDTKTLSTGKTFPYSQITKHQLHALLKLEIEGFPAGYLVWFREIDQIVFFSAKTLSYVKPGEGLDLKDGILCGSSEGFSVSLLFRDRDGGC